MKPFGANERALVTMFDFTELAGDLRVTRILRSMRREDLPFWTKTRDDGVRVVVPDPPTTS